MDQTQYSRDYSTVTSLLRQNYVMSCLEFSNNYFDKAVVMVQGSFA